MATSPGSLPTAQQKEDSVKPVLRSMPSRSSSARLGAGLSKRRYNENSFFGSIACSSTFEYTTLFVIFLNAIWLGIDTDLNHASNVHDTAIGFIIYENIFCSYFTFEVVVRFLAFKHKVECLWDPWFVFDTFLVALMVSETWLFPIVLPKGKDNPLDDLGALRLLRLLRLSRLIRLMRSVPELLTIVKGIVSAARSVASVLLFLILLDYVFAIVFTGNYQHVMGKEYTEQELELQGFFGSMGMSMLTLICNGTFLDDLAGLVSAIREDSVIMLIIFFVFITLSSFTVLNMLIGILCEVVEKTGNEEKAKMTMDTVREVIANAFEQIDKDQNSLISKTEFDAVCKDGDVIKTLAVQLGIEPSRLTGLRDLIFTDERELRFDEFLKLLIRLRPEELATSLDVQHFRKLLREQDFTLKRQCELLKLQVECCRALMNGGKVDNQLWTAVVHNQGGVSQKSRESFVSTANLDPPCSNGANGIVGCAGGGFGCGGGTQADRSGVGSSGFEAAAGDGSGDGGGSFDGVGLDGGGRDGGGGSGGGAAAAVAGAAAQAAKVLPLRMPPADDATQAQLVAEATDAEILEELKRRFEQANLRA